MNHKLALFFMTLILYSANIFGQYQQKWCTIETALTGDFTRNSLGGIKSGFSYIGMEELAFSLDLQQMGLWKGGEIYLHAINTHGSFPSQEYVGDLQVTSNIESGDYVGCYEYYLKQSLGNFEFLFGQHDLNAEFAQNQYGATFINSSFGIAPTLSLNVPVSIYPLASIALLAKYTTPNNHILTWGVYDGNPGDSESNKHNLQPNISFDDGFLIIGQYEKQYLSNKLPQTFKIGMYYHTHHSINYSDTLTRAKGNYGLYAVSDLVLWKNYSLADTYLAFFIQGGFAPEHLNQAHYYFGAGLHFNGILPHRFKDVLGIAAAFVSMSRPYRKIVPKTTIGELAIECTYKINISDSYYIQPNLQYVINPGANTNLQNTVVTSLRFCMSISN